MKSLIQLENRFIVVSFQPRFARPFLLPQRATDPSPGPRRLMKAPSRSTLSPRERAWSLYICGRPVPPYTFQPSPPWGRGWPAAGVFFNRGGPGEGVPNLRLDFDRDDSRKSM